MSFRWALHLLVFVLQIACSATRTYAHDIKGLTVEIQKSASPDLANALTHVRNTQADTKFVLNNLRLWPIPRRLTICFHDGSAELRKRVTDRMQQLWPIAELSDGQLAYDREDFDNPPDCTATLKADIRVALDERDGAWSYVGTESLQHDPSMNLKVEDVLRDTAEFDRIVGHEMGHALGLEHEHQSPAAPKCHWNYEWIFKRYNWRSEEDMRYNLDQLVDDIQNGKHAYIFSEYDPRSLMHYSFDEEAFHDGRADPCFIQENDVPSAQDKEALQVAYGPDAASRQNQLKKLLTNSLQAFEPLESAEIQSLIMLKASMLAE